MSPPRRPGDDGRGGRRPDQKSTSPRGDKAGPQPSGARPKGGSDARPSAAAAGKKPNRAKIRAFHSNKPKDGPATGNVRADAVRPEPVRAETPRADRPQRGARPPARPTGERSTGRRASEKPATERPTNARAARAGAFSERRNAERRDDAPERAARPERPSRVERASSPRQQDDRPHGERGAPRTDKPRFEPAGDRPHVRRGSERKPRERAAPAGPRIRRDGSAAIGRGRAPEVPATVHGKREPQRIAKLLARAGIASRREIERMIEEGRIAIDGKLLETPATIVTTLQGITVDGRQVEPPSHARLFIFHKPTGFLTTERDPRGRPTIYDRLPADLPRVMPIGRLDLNTEGLLLLTTDGELKRKMELPASGIPRVYRARAYGEINQEQLETLMDGVEIEGVRYGPIDANMERRTGRNVWIEMRLTEGKNREVRRVLEYLGLQVSRLIRVAYGEFILADLPAGELVEVRQNDLVEFVKTLK